jgi:hypothetical protein
MDTITQREQIRRLLVGGYRFSGLDALRNIGCYRLAARVHELRLDGMNIATEYTYEDGKRYAVYHAVKGRNYG